MADWTTMTRSIFGPYGALERLKVLRLLFEGPTLQQLQDSLSSIGLGGNLVLYGNQPANSRGLRYMLLNSGTQYVLLINGITTLYHGLTIWDGYAGPILIGGGQAEGKNLRVGEWANEILTRLGTMLDRASLVIISGHSAGGYAGYLVGAGLQRSSSTSTSPYVECFGTPLIGERENATAFDRIHHWFNDDDPVCVIPPRPSLNQPWCATFAPTQLIHLCQFVPIRCGTQLKQNGDMSEGTTPTGLPDPTWVSAGAWLLNLSQEVDTPHNIGNYVDRLQKAVDVRSSFQAEPVVSGTRGGRPFGVQEAGAIADSAVTQPYYQPREFPSDQVVLPKAQVFSARKLRKHAYGVFLGDAIVFVAPRRRAARRVARLGNELLRNLQVLARVDITAFTEELTNYLTLAKQDPAFTPLLHDA